MKAKKILLGVTGLYLAINMSAPIMAEVAQKIGTPTTSTISANTTSSNATNSTKSKYIELCKEAMRKYLGISAKEVSQIKDIKIEIKSNDQVLKDNQDLAKNYKKLYESKKVSEAEYKRILECIKIRKVRQYDVVICSFTITDSATRLKEYTVSFNDKTKEIIGIEAPLSKEAKQLLKNHFTTSLSKEKVEKDMIKFVKDNNVAGITNPECLEVELKDMPQVYIEDRDNLLQRVSITLDPVTGKVYRLRVM